MDNRNFEYMAAPTAPIEELASGSYLHAEGLLNTPSLGSGVRGHYRVDFNNLPGGTQVVVQGESGRMYEFQLHNGGVYDPERTMDYVRGGNKTTIRVEWLCSGGKESRQSVLEIGSAFNIQFLREHDRVANLGIRKK